MFVIAVSTRVYEDNLRNAAWPTGYVLMGMILFLAAFNVRKKLSFLPMLGSASTWMQLHIYIGILSGFLFGVHVSWRVPNGPFEMLLASLFGLTFFSGCYGLIITRLLPKKIASLREQFIYERIPELKRRIALSAHRLVSGVETQNETLFRFYINRVAAFLNRPRSLAFNINPSNRECRRLVDDIAAMDRYLSPPEREISRTLMQYVREKDDFDYSWALQSRLKYWLFLHIALTFSLLVLMAFHVVMAHAFGGGVR
jgi:hypothetical protein